MTEKKDLEIGKRYLVNISDCCVFAEVDAGRFLGRNPVEAEFEIEFENIRFQYERGEWRAEEVL